MNEIMICGIGRMKMSSKLKQREIDRDLERDIGDRLQVPVVRLISIAR